MTLVARSAQPGLHWSSETVRSTWLIVHIVLALLGYAALLFTAVAAVAYLMQERQLKRKQPRSFYRLFPPLGTLDELISRSLGAGFVFITISIIIAIVWAYIEYGTSWIDNGLITHLLHHLGNLPGADFFPRERRLAGPKSRDPRHCRSLLLRGHMDRALPPGEPSVQ